MRLNLVPLLFAASLIPLALTLQTIYLGYIGSSGLYVLSGVQTIQPINPKKSPIPVAAPFSLLTPHPHPIPIIPIPAPSSLPTPITRNPNPKLTYPLPPYSPHFIAFFSDSPPCTDGAIFGYTPEGFADNCNTNITILGHPDISFTGCKPVSTFPFTLPTAVSDGGTPALKCKPTTNPQGTATPYANCPYSPSASIVGPVELLEYCS